jgi:glycosyltransferase involved in cell wall biosynthesis
MKIQDLSIIICSYNEEKTVCDVVTACRLFNPKSEIIVVDDGSEDNSEQLLYNLAKTVEFKYIRHHINKGKSYAMVTGIKHAKHNIILFWDADSSGIRKEHFEIMLKPILNNEADMVLGHTAAKIANYNLSPFKSYTGERVLLKKDLNLILDEIEDLRFGIETYINFYYESHGKRVKYVLLEGLRTLTKFKKTRLIDATKEYFKEGNEIASILLKNYKSKALKIGTSFLDPPESIRKSLLNAHQNTSKKIQNIYQKLNRQNFI